MARKDLFDKVIDKQFTESSPVTIAKPVGGERPTSFEDRRRAAGSFGSVPPSEPDRSTASGAAHGSAAVQPAVVQEEKKTGRPRVREGETMNMNFKIQKELKHKLDELKVKQYRSSVTDLMLEAIRDLLTKYGVE